MSKRTTGRRVPGFDKPLPAPVVLGLDLSLRFTCAVAVPSDWRCDWTKVATLRTGSSLPRDAQEHERVRRLQYIVDDVAKFAKAQNAALVFIEQYAFSADTSQAHAIGELGGAVKVELQSQLNLPLVMVSPASARALFGKQPRADRKQWAGQRLLEAGAPRDWIGPAEDRWGIFDAFSMANFGLSENGGQAVVLREQQELGGIR